jgi:hypothetical protein
MELQSVLNDPMFHPVATAWANKKKQDPQWYSLFDNTNDLRQLAISLDLLSVYERRYRPWCRQVHATGTLAAR